MIRILKFGKSRRLRPELENMGHDDGIRAGLLSLWLYKENNKLRD
jgi:hypothetical protein